MKFTVQAPSNIALIKYMGKTDSKLNLPENPSLSMTLNSLRTYMSIEIENGSSELRIGAGSVEGFEAPALSGLAIEKMQKHWTRMRDAAPALLKIVGLESVADVRVSLQTANTFPMGSGIASSASSFAALTLAGLLAHSKNPDQLREIWKLEKSLQLKRSCAAISRQGSGSSCRSFEGPFVQWIGSEATRVESALPEMAHFVVVISASEKKVSSSEAHARVKTSPSWEGRVERTTQRFGKIKSALIKGDIKIIAQTSWSEMWEMHELFHTAQEPFSYWAAGTIHALHTFAEDLKLDYPPIVTLDAGPNIHVIVEKSRSVEWKNILETRFGSVHLLTDGQGLGATIL